MVLAALEVVAQQQVKDLRRGGHVLGHVEPFRMHLVFRKILDANGLKGPRADVKRDILDVDPLGRKPAEKILGEVKAGRWSGHGAGIAGIDRLIAVLIL